MSLSRPAAWTAFILVTILPAFAHAGQQPPPMPKPGPEHEIFKMDEGVWDAIVEFVPAPGAPPITSKGVETNTIGCGGLCLISDFKGDMGPGGPFHGHGTAAWDAVRKKYVGSWTDSMAHGLSISEATWDPVARRMTGLSEGPDMTGKVTKMRTEMDYKDGGRAMTAYVPGPDGKDIQVVRITYTKRK